MSAAERRVLPEITTIRSRLLRIEAAHDRGLLDVPEEDIDNSYPDGRGIKLRNIKQKLRTSDFLSTPEQWLALNGKVNEVREWLFQNTVDWTQHPDPDRWEELGDDETDPSQRHWYKDFRYEALADKSSGFGNCRLYTRIIDPNAQVEVNLSFDFNDGLSFGMEFEDGLSYDRATPKGQMTEEEYTIADYYLGQFRNDVMHTP